MAGSCQTIGQIIGIFISTSVFVNLNSVAFNNNYLHWYNGKIDTPILTLDTYLFIVAIALFSGSFILFFIKEDKIDISEEEGLFQTLNKIKQMSKNSALRNFIPMLLLSKIGQIFYNRVIGLVLIEKGFSQATLTNISTLLIPVELTISYVLSGLKHNFMKKYLKSYKNLIYIFIAEFVFIYAYDYIKQVNEFSNIPIIIFVIGISLVKTCVMIFYFNSMSGFLYKICDNKIGATYITALNSANNLSEKWPGIFIFSAVDFIGYEIVGLLSIFYCIFYYNYFYTKLIKLEELDENEWKLKLGKTDKLI